MRSRDEKHVNVRSLLIWVLAIGVLAVWLIWWQWDPMLDRLCGSRSETIGLPAMAEEPPGPAAAEEVAPSEAERAWAELFGEAPSWPEDFSSPQSCQAVEEQLMKLCLHLDAPGEEGGSCTLLKQAAEALAARPPVLDSELRQLESVLGNTFHLFRVLHGERMDRARRLLREEGGLAEPAAMTIYRWLITRERCARSGKTAIRMAPLYDYACFLFQSIGGQAYLRRRSPEVEALASFYALLIVDRALEQKHNPHGLDPRPEIRRTRQLIADSHFLFEARYLERLDDMSRRWNGEGRLSRSE